MSDGELVTIIIVVGIICVTYLISSGRGKHL